MGSPEGKALQEGRTGNAKVWRLKWFGLFKERGRSEWLEQSRESGVVGVEVKEETTPKAEFTSDPALLLPGVDPEANPSHVPSGGGDKSLPSPVFNLQQGNPRNNSNAHHSEWMNICRTVAGWNINQKSKRMNHSDICHTADHF